MKTILEPSTNTHSTESNVEIMQEKSSLNTIVLRTNGEMIVEHGHHFTVATLPETKCVVKVTQQELNPILNLMQEVTD